MAMAIRGGRIGLADGSDLRNFFSYRTFGFAMLTLLFFATFSILFSSHPSHLDFKRRIGVGRTILGDNWRFQLIKIFEHSNLLIQLIQLADYSQRPMAASKDPWVSEYNEAAKLAEDITNMISESSSFSVTGLETQRHSASIRRKITILGTRLDTLEFPAKQPLTQREMIRRKDMIVNLRSKVIQMASTMNMSNFANRDSLLEPESKPVDAMSRTTGLDDSGFVDLQRQIMKEQDEALEELEETIISTKHIALTVNEELDLHTRLIDSLEEEVDVIDSRLQLVQRKLAFLNKRAKDGCSCSCLLLSVIAIMVLVAVVHVL